MKKPSPSLRSALLLAVSAAPVSTSNLLGVRRAESTMRVGQGVGGDRPVGGDEHAVVGAGLGEQLLGGGVGDADQGDAGEAAHVAELGRADEGELAGLALAQHGDACRRARGGRLSKVVWSMTASVGARGALPVAMVNGLRRSSSTQLAPITPPKPEAASALPSGPTRAAWPSIDPAAASTPSMARIWSRVAVSTRSRTSPSKVALHRRRPPDDDVDALVGALEEAVEGLAHGVGEDLGAGHEGHAEDDGEAGEGEAQLVGPQALPCQIEHGPTVPNVFMRSRTASAVGSLDLVDDAAVGEEDDPVGVAGRARVVGDHDDGLAQLPHGPAHEVEDLGAGAAVEVAGGLVGEDDLRPPGQGPGHRHPLLLAAGELAGPVLEPVARGRWCPPPGRATPGRACARPGPWGG